MADMFQVDPNLMRSACFRPAFHKSKIILMGEHAVGSNCRFSLGFFHYHHLFSMNAVAPNRRVDNSRRRSNSSGNHCEINLGHFPGGELPGKLLMREIVLRHDNAATRFPVEPMHDSRALHATDHGK